MLFSALDVVRNELLLFAGVGLLIGGVDDLLIDFIYSVRRVWRLLTVYSRIPRMRAPDLPPPGHAGPMAIFVPAWDEAAVIAPMLRRCLDLWAGEDMQIFVGTYPNDRATIDRVVETLAALGPAGGADKVTLVINDRPGPTTKADCLNALWRALGRWEAAQGRTVLAVVLHDAEDVVHRDALRLLGLLAPRFALVQLPVLPLASAHSRWISGHYCDEFAEAHGKSLLVREALGAGLPSAGVGCSFNRATLGRIAAERDQRPFDPGSLTEDYELGLRIGELGERGILARMRDAQGDLIATQEYFPDTLSAAVRQKARWTLGIAFAGWDRLGWTGRWREGWMRLRDRRAALSALVLCAAYLGLLVGGASVAADLLRGRPPAPWPEPLGVLLAMNSAMLVWRLLVRVAFVWRSYGWLEALRSVPRTIIANIIAMMAARRAFFLYLRELRGERAVWDKTAHRFPDAPETESA